MVFVPGFSKKRRYLEKRKGGGGGGKGGGGGAGRGSGGGDDSGAGGGTSGSAGGGRSSSLSFGGSSRTSSTSSSGGGAKSTIPQSQSFAGRQQGGGTRNQVYGNNVYGSGYPGVAPGGVRNLGFPFYYWPVIWGSATVIGTGNYIHSQGEYGDVNNGSRPGGPLMTAAFPSSSNSNSTFRIMSDNATVTSLITSIVSSSCNTSIASPSSISATPYNDSGPPLPGQAVQYYRASSVVLSLDSYNNSAVYSNDTNAPPSPLPNNTDTTLLACLNNTIGANVPLVDGAYGLRWSSPSSIGLVALALSISRLVAFV